MRISDWSSDVCSSDLVTNSFSSLTFVFTSTINSGDETSRLVEPHRRHIHDDQIGLMGIFSASDDNPVLSTPLEQNQLFLFSDLIIQIGRASCRERVCQHVWISVVALALKKKNK